MPLDLTADQLFMLAEVEARGFVGRVKQDLVREDSSLCADTMLAARLWWAFEAARDMGIEKDSLLVAFLRVEAYAPQFYARPAMRAWLNRPGYDAEQRFEDYRRVMRWCIERPEYAKGLLNGGISCSATGSGCGGTWARIVAGWRRLVGWGDRGRNGQSVR